MLDIVITGIASLIAALAMILIQLRAIRKALEPRTMIGVTQGMGQFRNRSLD